MGISPKGLENPTLDSLIQNYEAALTVHAGVKSYSWTELEQLTAASLVERGLDPSLLTARDVRKYAKRQKLMNGYDFAEVVDRSSAIRIFFLVAAGCIPLSRALPNKGILESPSSILRRFHEFELPLRMKHDHADVKFSLTHEKALMGQKAFKEWFWGGFPEINTSFGSLYLPRTCYIDSLNAMSVPIWELGCDTPKPYVKGSLEDSFREVDQDLFIGTVVTLQRLR